MLPIKDLNPTARTPVATLVVIAACIGVYFLVQQAPSTRWVQTPAGPVQVNPALASTFFNLEHAAIPCEVVTGEPLDLEEVAALSVGDTEACQRAQRSPQLFPDKNVYLAVLVSMFLHGGVLHLGGNVLFLWIFGNNVEDRLGHLPFVAFYLACGLVATVAHIAVHPDSTVPLVGASGAIAGVMGAYLVWFPNAPVLSWVAPFFLLPIRAKWFLVIWFGLQFLTDPNEGVAWVAHVGGFLAGVLGGIVLGGGGGARRQPAAGPWPPPPGPGPHWP